MVINIFLDQTCYIRPMSDLFKNNSNIINSYNSTKNESLEVNQPVRVRKKNRAYANVSNELNAYKKYLLGICHTFFLQDSEGYTISHSQDNEMPKNTVRLRTHYKRNGGQLMNCSKFTESFHVCAESYHNIKIITILVTNIHFFNYSNLLKCILKYLLFSP